MPFRWRWAVIAAGFGVWAWWGWWRLAAAAVPAYGPVAHHAAALQREAAAHLLFGALLLLACGLELIRGRRGPRRGPFSRSPSTASTTPRSGGIRLPGAETRVRTSGR
ncbi:MAG TPA: hypothetical protein VIK93_09360 [Limnochordales bacterium]